MAVAGTINARLPEDLKRHGAQVLDREGVSVTQAIRSLFEYLEREQTVPEWMQAEGKSAAEIARKRKKLRSLVGIAEITEDFDGRAAYRQHVIDKCAPGVRQ